MPPKGWRHSEDSRLQMHYAAKLKWKAPGHREKVSASLRRFWIQNANWPKRRAPVWRSAWIMPLTRSNPIVGRDPSQRALPRRKKA
jgi:hypothetical protein